MCENIFWKQKRNEDFFRHRKVERVPFQADLYSGKGNRNSFAKGPHQAGWNRLHQKQCSQGWLKANGDGQGNSFPPGLQSESSSALSSAPPHQPRPHFPLWIFLSICRKSIFPCNSWGFHALSYWEKESLISKDKWISLLKCKLSHCGTISGLRTHLCIKGVKLPCFQILSKDSRYRQSQPHSPAFVKFLRVCNYCLKAKHLCTNISTGGGRGVYVPNTKAHLACVEQYIRRWL